MARWDWPRRGGEGEGFFFDFGCDTGPERGRSGRGALPD